jgi:hypothetical protein
MAIEYQGYRVEPIEGRAATITKPWRIIRLSDGAYTEYRSEADAMSRLLHHLAGVDLIPSTRWIQPPKNVVGGRFPASHLLSDIGIALDQRREMIAEDRRLFEDDAEDVNRNDAWLRDWEWTNFDGRFLRIVWPDGSRLELYADYTDATGKDISNDVVHSHPR